MVELQSSPHLVLRGLHPGVVAGSPPVVVELDPPGKGASRHGNRVLGIQATQLQAAGEDENVRRKPMAALVGREPEIVRRDVSGERAVHRGAPQRTASVAAPVAADENQRSGDDHAFVVEGRFDEVLVPVELDPTYLRCRFLRSDDEDGTAHRGTGPPDEEQTRPRRSR